MSKILFIGGLGRIGLVMSAIFGQHHEIFIYDTNNAANHIFRFRRKAIFYEQGLNKELKTANINLCELSKITDCDFTFITIGTFIDAYLNPKFDVIFSVFNDIKPYIPRLKKKHVIILSSTVYPGTTKKIEKKIAHSIAFCPERMATTSMIKEFREMPQIISANDITLLPSINSLFSSIGINTEQLYNTTEAELAKLFTNAYRYITFAISNQFYMMAQDFDCDYNEINRAMTSNYPRMQNYWRPGFVGGSCLIKDTLQLAAHDGFELGHAAFRINEKLPLHIFRNIRSLFGDDLPNKIIGILGMAFKGNTDDGRDSLAYRLRNILKNECRVICSDEYIKNQSFVSAETLIKYSDLIIIGAYHDRYYRLIPFCNVPYIDLMKKF